MASTNILNDPYAQMEDLSAYLRTYCAETGKDFDFYKTSLDQSKTIDPALLNDPAFQAYWRLTNLQLNELIDPAQINSDAGQIALPDEAELNLLYAATSPEMQAFNNEAVTRDAGYASFLVKNEANQGMDSLLTMFQDSAASSVDTDAAIIQAVSGTGATAEVSAGYYEEVGSETNAMEYSADARRFAAEYGYQDELSYAIGTEEGIRGTEGSIMTMLSEMDQQLVDLKEALQTGAISAEQFAADADNISVYRETLLSMMNQLESTLSSVMETLSKLIEQAIEGRMAIINNSRAV